MTEIPANQLAQEVDLYRLSDELEDMSESDLDAALARLMNENNEALAVG